MANIRPIRTPQPPPSRSPLDAIGGFLRSFVANPVKSVETLVWNLTSRPKSPTEQALADFNKDRFEAGPKQILNPPVLEPTKRNFD